MNQPYIFLFALWSAFNLSDAWDADEHTTEDLSDAWDADEHTTEDLFMWDADEHTSGDLSDAWDPDEHTTEEPNITVYRQMEDRDHVIVLCKFAEVFTTRRQSFELSVESELNYNIEPLQFPFSSPEMYVFMVTVIPPAFFTCVHEIGFDPDVRNLRSQTYNYSGSVSDHHEEGASSLYICFSSFIAVGLFIMTAAVIVTNIRSKTKDTNSTEVTDNDYVEA